MRLKRRAKGEAHLFKIIWGSKPHKCELCGDPIPAFDYYCFSHILGKQSYPELRLYRYNIALSCRGCHDLWTHHHYDMIHEPEWNWFVGRYVRLKRLANYLPKDFLFSVKFSDRIYKYMNGSI